jgi:hypothetical protein
MDCPPLGACIVGLNRFRACGLFVLAFLKLGVEHILTGYDTVPAISGAQQRSGARARAQLVICVMVPVGENEAWFDFQSSPWQVFITLYFYWAKNGMRSISKDGVTN